MSPHSSSSSTTSSTDGSAYPWILEHLLAYPGTYEIPLRTMYTLNSTPSAQQRPQQPLRTDTPSLSSAASSLDGSPQSPEFPPDQQHQLPEPNATDHFKQCLMEHISQLPSQPFSLPPAFITSFVRRCFTEDLCMVDFTQALTAMDYLKDIETRRRRELSMALQRLGLDKAVVDQHTGNISRDPRISDWVKSMQDKERKVEALYTQVYIGLRRWVCPSGYLLSHYWITDNRPRHSSTKCASSPFRKPTALLCSIRSTRLPPSLHRLDNSHPTSSPPKEVPSSAISRALSKMARASSKILNIKVNA